MDEKRLPFLAHLDELRVRFTRSVIALAIGVVVCFLFAESIFDFVAAPLVTALKHSPELHIQSPMEVFYVYLKLSLLAGIIASMPFILLQMWLFVAPGLYKGERRLAVSFVFFGTVFFIGGIAFAYYLVFPFGFKYLLGYAYERAGNFSILEQMTRAFNDVKYELFSFNLEVNYEKARFVKAAIKPTIMMEKYITLVVKLLLAFGLVFELPLVLFFLARVGLVTHRGLIKFFRYWVVIAFLLAAVLTPPDVITQVMMAGPLILMYLSGIVAAWLITTGRERRERREAAALGYRDEDDEELERDEDAPGDDEDGEKRE
ncbi:MAG: twin-arginine translocase subunit TatC [bacterium]